MWFVFESTRQLRSRPLSVAPAQRRKSSHRANRVARTITLDVTIGPAHVFYFAYGSNMNWQQMQRRCPSARFIGVALLRDHKLAFTRRSIRRNCGVADAVPRPGQKLWGVVYEIADLDVGELDKLACARFRRHRVRCFSGTGGGSWRGGSLRESSSLRRYG